MIVSAVGYICAGVLLGVATLPWKDRLSNESMLMWFVTWACFWPYLTVLAAARTLLAYGRAWQTFIARRR